MALKEQLLNDLKDAMKNKDTEKKNVIQIVKTEILYSEKQKQADKNKGLDEDADIAAKEDLSDAEIIDIISKEIKKRYDVLPEYEKSGRADSIESVNRQIEILQSYLPKQLDDQELAKLVEEAINETGASSMKDMGKVVSLTKEKASGGADGQRISKMVKESLSK